MNQKANGSSQEQALQSRVKRARGGHTGGRDKSRVQCYQCQKFGHLKFECRENERVEQAYASVAHDNMVLGGKTKDTCGGYTDVWYLDSGCSNHMSGRKELLSHLDESARVEVSFGNKSQIQVMGNGDIQIQTNDGTYATIANVYYIPGLC
ncbi:unnamed protein product [Rhodiola kirilowii]